MPTRTARTAAEVTRADGTHALRALLDPQQAETKQERLLRAAFNVIGERGYESTSAARIVRAAQMAPGLVHYYFASKDDLLVAVADWCSHLFDGALVDLPELDDGFELLRSRIERIQDLVALVAWRNSSRCIGRLYWRSLRVRDRRQVNAADQIAAECVGHLREATNGEMSGVKVADHHIESERFLAHVEQEQRHGRRCPADWSWIVPPTAGSTTPVFHRSYHDFDASPNFRRHAC